jgi:hypothetical protein
MVMNWPLVGHALGVAFFASALAYCRRWPRFYALAIWFGTLSHELTHWLSGGLMAARPMAISVWPRQLPDGSWRYGRVLFANLRWWNKPVVGLAPLALFPLAGWLVWHSTALPLFSVGGLACKLLAVQLLFSAWPSRQDFRHALAGALVMVMLAGAAYGAFLAWRGFY